MQRLYVIGGKIVIKWEDQFGDFHRLEVPSTRAKEWKSLRGLRVSMNTYWLHRAQNIIGPENTTEEFDEYDRPSYYREQLGRKFYKHKSLDAAYNCFYARQNIRRSDW